MSKVEKIILGAIVILTPILGYCLYRVIDAIGKMYL